MKTIINLNIMAFLLFSVNAMFAQKPNFVWIVSEDNSKHYLNLYNDTGVETPNIKSLAEDGLIFNHAFSNAPVCSAARSTLISGVYGARLASHYHRNIREVNMPTNLNVWTRYLAEAGYHTSNDSKTDFNFTRVSAWTGGARNRRGWRDREDGQPFFHFYTTMSSHESKLHFKNMNESLPFDIDTIFVNPRHPNTELFRYTGGLYRKRIAQMDEVVGNVIQELKNDGLYDNTFIFYFGDHGGALPGSKGYNYETGLHVPLVVHVPENFKHLVDFEQGSRVDGFVSFVDFGVTVLNLAGVDIPEGFDGTPFLGANISAEAVNQRDETFSYADRFDEKYDFVRSVRKGRYKYTRNYEPFNHDGIWNNYRYRQLAFREWKKLYDQGQLNDIQASFFETKPVEMLYDIENDEYETINLADNASYSNTLSEMRSLLDTYLEEANDISFYPEFHLIQNAFPDSNQFGRNQASELERLRAIADLQLVSFSEASSSLRNALRSDNPWERYWALIVCSTFKNEAAQFTNRIRRISTDDSETRYNKMRALQFLALQEGVHSDQLANAMVDNMYKATSDAECGLYLNAMVMLKEKLGFKFMIDKDKISEDLMKSFMVRARVNYLYTVANDTVSNVIPHGKHNLIFADSEENVREIGQAENAFDNNPSTSWFTRYSNPKDDYMPHELIFSLDSLHLVNGFRYIPRQRKETSGRIGSYRLYASDSLHTIKDNKNLVASGQWDNDTHHKELFFDAKEAKFFRLVALSDLGENNQTAAAEIRVFGNSLGRLGDTATTLPDGSIDNYLTNGTYRIVNRRSGKCLVNRNNASANGTPVVQMTSDASRDENWIIRRLGNGEFSIVHQRTKLFADISRASANPGTNNILWRDNGGDNQKWKIVYQGNGYYHIINVKSNLFLDIAGRSREDGAQNIQWTNNGRRNQDWSFVPASNGNRTNALIVDKEKTLNPKDEFIIYPNPIDGNKEVTLDIPQNYFNGILKVIGINGKTYIKKEIHQEKMHLKLEKIKEGVYFINISNGNESKTQKVIIK